MHAKSLAVIATLAASCTLAAQEAAGVSNRQSSNRHSTEQHSGAPACRLSAVAEGYARSSVNTAVFRNSSIVSADSAGTMLQFCSFYTPEGHLAIARRTLPPSGAEKGKKGPKNGKNNSTANNTGNSTGNSTGNNFGNNSGNDCGEWQVAETDYRARVEDGHNVISMGIDGQGYLHVAYDHHGHPLHYRRSVAPYSPILGPEMPMTGRDEKEVTYPEFHRLASGNLIFLYRTGRSGAGNMVMNVYDAAQGIWTRVQDNLIDGEGRRNAYWQLCADARGRLHLSWVWRETWMVETNHDICYAASDDEGRTWHRSDGSPYSLPIRLSSAEVAWAVPQRSELINQTSMAADADGHPYVATYWRAQTDSVPQYRLVWHDGRRWHMSQVGERRTPFSLAGGGTKMIPISRPRVVTDGRRAMLLFRDQERGSRVSAFSCRRLSRPRWKTTDLTPFEVGAWEPSIDEELWSQKKRLCVFVQTTRQGDGEKTVKNQPPTTVYVMEAEF